MRRSSLAVVVVLVVSLLVGGGPATSTASDEEADRAAVTGTRLVPQGRWIVDRQGRVQLLHGVNMVYKLWPYAPDRIGFGRDDARFLARMGFTTVRLGLIWRAVEPRPGEYNDAYLARIRRTARILAAEGIWTLLDFHQDLYHERFEGEGAPTWAVQDDGLPAEPKAGFPNNYFGMAALNRAFDHFFDNADGPGGVGLQDRYAAAWAHVAQVFRNEDRILGFDLFNEPWAGTGWQQCANPAGCPVLDARLEAFTERAVRAIRAVDRRTAVFYEPYVLFNSGADNSVRPAGRRLAYSFHDYCLVDNQTSDQTACREFDDLVWANTRDHVAATGHPPLLTEFGATRKQPSLRDMVLRAQRNLTGWQYWAYCGCDDPTTTGPGATQALVLDPARRPSGRNVDRAKLRALVVPHPLVVAGTPRWSRFSRETRWFAARWTTARVGGGRFRVGAVSVLSTPRFVYPRGYRVRVVGARVISRPNAPRLVLAQRAGADVVTVRVGRR